MNVKKAITGLALICLHTTICAQQGGTMAEMLKEEGFDDIRIATVADTIFASIEDNAYRGVFRGVATAIKQMERSNPDAKQFELLLTEYRMPQLIVHASKREGIWDVRVDRQMERARLLLKDVTPLRPSTGRIDLTFYPMVSLVNIYLDHLFDYNIRIAPAIGINLWRGARLTLQPVIPVVHRLTDKADEGRVIQFGVNDIQQQIVSSKRWKVSAALGFFTNNRVGAQAKVEFHPTRNLHFHINAGLTGYQGFTRVRNNAITLDYHSEYKITNWKQWNTMAGADFYEPYTKLQFELQGGRFLFGDYGTRLDVTRHFSEYAIGLYGIYTGGEKNVGFHFAIPLGGKRQKRNGYIRPRLPEYFAWEYSMEANGKYTSQMMGESFNVRPDQNRSAHYWEPAFIENYVKRILNGTFE